MPEFKDPNNYYLLRAVPHEQRVRLYKVENGKRTTFTGKNLAIPVDTWHELKFVVSGNAFTASFNGAELFTFKDDTFKDAGRRSAPSLDLPGSGWSQEPASNGLLAEAVTR